MATPHPRLSVSADFRRSLASTKVRDVVPPRHVVYARCTDSIASVFKLLVDNKILSVPVLDNLTNKFVAFVDILDILVYVVDRLRLDDERVSMGPLLESWVTQIEFQVCNNQVLQFSICAYSNNLHRDSTATSCSVNPSAILGLVSAKTRHCTCY